MCHDLLEKQLTDNRIFAETQDDDPEQVSKPGPYPSLC